MRIANKSTFRGGWRQVGAGGGGGRLWCDQVRPGHPPPILSYDAFDGTTPLCGQSEWHKPVKT